MPTEHETTPSINFKTVYVLWAQLGPHIVSSIGSSILYDAPLPVQLNLSFFYSTPLKFQEHFDHIWKQQCPLEIYDGSNVPMVDTIRQSGQWHRAQLFFTLNHVPSWDLLVTQHLPLNYWVLSNCIYLEFLKILNLDGTRSKTTFVCGRWWYQYLSDFLISKPSHIMI